MKRIHLMQRFKFTLIFFKQDVHFHPKATKGNKNEVGAPMPGTVIGKLKLKHQYESIVWLI